MPTSLPLLAETQAGLPIFWLINHVGFAEMLSDDSRYDHKMLWFALCVKREFNLLDELNFMLQIWSAMKTPSTIPDDSGMSLPEYLGTVRQSKGFTLREVQDATDNAVSNAYLSQLENGKIQKPSPNILHALAEVYGIDYTLLMEKAGYITAVSRSTIAARHGRLATLSKMDLTTEEEEELFRYLNYLRHSRNVRRDAS